MIQGIQGDAGADGEQGIQGIQGIQGDAGADGADGAQGIQGIQGDAGTDGADGAQGIQGIQGDAGADGADGIDGTDGADGAVAEFIDQVDTPTSYTGKAGLAAVVNAAEDGLEFLNQGILADIASGEALAILHMGQSNAAGTGVLAGQTTNPLIQDWFSTDKADSGNYDPESVTNFRFAEADPTRLNGFNGNTQVAVGMSGDDLGNTAFGLCRRVVEKAGNRTIYIVHISAWNQSVDSFLTGGMVRDVMDVQLPAAMAALNALGIDKFHAFLWQQGGADYVNNMNPIVYRDKWLELRDHLKTEDYIDDNTRTLLFEENGSIFWDWKGHTAIGKYTDNRTKLISTRERSEYWYWAFQRL